jgi:putative ATP-binding cassette transporter
MPHPARRRGDPGVVCLLTKTILEGTEMEITKLLSYLLRMSRSINLSLPAIVVALVTGLISGLGLTGLLAIISNVIAGKTNPWFLYAFIALCVVVPTSRLISQSLFNIITTRAVFETRLQSCRRILAAPLRRLEEIGPHRLLATLTDDITTLSTALTQIPLLCLHLGVVIACLIYLGWLSWRVLLIVIGIMVLGSLSYGYSMGHARRYFGMLREETDTLFQHFRSLIFGAKELKLHGRRREVFVSSALIPTGDAIRRFQAIGNNIFTATAVWGNLLFFIAIGIIIFVFRGASFANPRVVSGYTLSLLYILSPLEVIFQILPNLSRAAAAINKLERIGIDLGSRAAETSEVDPGHVGGWQKLEIRDIHYTYSGEANSESESFSIGPMSLSFHSGELIFITGGNGSGKSTFAKILTGLYVPDTGEILLDGKPITIENRESYRQMFSTVFADFYLFENLIGLEGVDLDESARDYLVRLQLDRKVQVQGGKLSTLDLSQGQRKRLALLTAYMEQRQIYFFDEWAADQDPQFKAVFYFELLPELKARGKTVFVISHDDQYYGLADQLIKMKDGQVEFDRMQSPAVATSAKLAEGGR